MALQAEMARMRREHPELKCRYIYMILRAYRRGRATSAMLRSLRQFRSGGFRWVSTPSVSNDVIASMYAMAATVVQPPLPSVLWEKAD